VRSRESRTRVRILRARAGGKKAAPEWFEANLKITNRSQEGGCEAGGDLVLDLNEKKESAKVVFHGR